MKDLLESEFLESYNFRKINPPIICTYNDPFSLSDQVACENCVKSYGTSIYCANKGVKEVARFDNNNEEIQTIEFETFALQYQKYRSIQGSICDFIHYMTNKDKFVLNELTCCKKIYIKPYTCDGREREGKLEHARSQINHSINILYNVLAIGKYIDGFKNKIGLFSCRLKSLDENSSSKDKAEDSMSSFLKPMKIVSNIQTLGILNKNFIFEQRIYPEVYKF